VTQEDWADLARQLIEAVKDNGPSPTDWISAISAAATLVIAIIAAGIALFQLIQGKRLERDKAQPYVVMSMRESISPEFIDIVIRNYGQTAAYDVKVELSPAPKRAQAAAEEVHLPEVIPVMAPGQEWRCHWDSAKNRLDSGLPDRHEGTVTYYGEKKIYKQQITSAAILDWSIYKSRLVMVEYTVHDLTKAVRGIRENQEKWTEGTGGSLRVTARSGHKKDEDLRRQRDEYFREKEAEGEKPAARRRATPRQEPVGDPQNN
jgi:hypothetical protein